MSRFHRHTTIAALILAITLSSGCDKTTEPATQTQPAKADPNLVSVPDAMLASLRIESVSQKEIREELRVASRAVVDEQRVARIGATVTGRVTQVNAILGQNVKNGMVLASLNSSELGEAQLSYLKAQAHLKLQERAVERARMLLEAEVIGSAELLRRESELSTTRAELNSSLNQLKVLGMSNQAIRQLASSGNINSTSPVSATLSGTVIERNVTQGQVVQPAEALFTVADLSHVWIVAEVPEHQADLVSEGEEVTVEIPALNNRRLAGKLIYVGDTINPETRTVTVRTDVLNNDRSIKPDMLASMVIQGKPVLRTVVPEKAVVRESDKDHIFVQTAANQFRLRQVTLGTATNGLRPLINGLQLGDKIVVDGAFHLNNERKRKELEE